jgi:hypothetical protein
MLRFLKSVGIALAAAVILFEEWLWEPLKRLMLAFSRLPVIRQLAGFIARLPPIAALVLYLVPVVVLLPFKIAGLWLIGQGHSVLGISTFLAAKIVGTALLAWLFSLTKPALMQIGWFASTHAWVVGISDSAHAWLHGQPLYQAVRKVLANLRASIQRVVGGNYPKR